MRAAREWKYIFGIFLKGESKMRSKVFGLVLVLSVVFGMCCVEGFGKGGPPDRVEPVAVITAMPEYAIIGQDITFDGSESEDQDPGPGNGITKYAWDFDNDGTYDYEETEGDSPDGSFDGIKEYSYDSPGTYIVTLEVTDNDKPAMKDTETVTVYIGIPRSVPAQEPTIQDAIDTAQDGDMIIVNPGTYYEDIDFKGKKITIQSTNPDDWGIVESTVIEGSVEFNEQETYGSAIKGIKITSSSPLTGTGIFIAGGADFTYPIIANCIIENYYYGIGCYGDNAPHIQNCKIRNNKLGIFVNYGYSVLWTLSCWIYNNETGIAFLNDQAVAGAIANNTIVGNSNCGVNIRYLDIEFANNILWDNGDDIFTLYCDLTPEYCCIEEDGYSGPGNISVNPLFVDAANNDYHLQAISPCVDAGGPWYTRWGYGDTDIDGDSRFMDGDNDGEDDVDMGADEYKWPAEVEIVSHDEGDIVYVNSTVEASCVGDVGPYNWSGDGTFNPTEGQSVMWTVPSTPGEVTITVTAANSSDSVTLIAVVCNNELYVAPWGIDAPERGSRTEPFATIQYGIVQASDGDVVIALDGIYDTTPENADPGYGFNHSLDFSEGLPYGETRAITVRSENGPDNCIIDCYSSSVGYRGFYFHTDEVSDSVVSGFTITNGNSSGGGAIFCNEASPTITNCTFISNIASGGAIYCYNSTAKIINCLFQGNHTLFGGSGGAISCGYSGAGPIIRNCKFVSNEASLGGAIFNGPDGTGGNLTVINCDFYSNASGVYGLHGGGGAIKDNSIGSLKMVNCKFKYNWTECPDYGGAVFKKWGELEMANCAVTGNSSEGSGGGIACALTNQSVITNCTITNNLTGGYGGGIYSAYSNLIVGNSILWGNGMDVVRHESELDITYSDAEFCYIWDGLDWWVDPSYAGGAGNIFPPQNPKVGSGYILATNSPCIDAGNNLLVPADEGDLDRDGNTAERLPMDVDERTRFVDGPMPNVGVADPPDYPEIVDMGAYEYQN